MQCALPVPALGEEFAVTLKTTESFYSCPVGMEPKRLLAGGGGWRGWVGI